MPSSSAGIEDRRRTGAGPLVLIRGGWTGGCWRVRAGVGGRGTRCSLAQADRALGWVSARDDAGTRDDIDGHWTKPIDLDFLVPSNLGFQTIGESPVRAMSSNLGG